MRMFSVADQRSIPEISVEGLVAVACRELLLTDEVRARAAELAGQQPRPEHGVAGGVGDMLARLAEGIPVDGMEALLPVLRPDDMSLLTDQLADGTPVLVCDPEKVRTRAADLIKTGREFLEASWSVAAVGGDSPIDVEQLGGSGFRELDEVRLAARQSGHPWWTLSQLSDESAIELDIRTAPSARGHQRDIDEIFAMLRAHVATGGAAAVVAPGTGTAHRVVEQLAESDTPATMLEPGAEPKPGVVGVLKGPLHDGLIRVSGGCRSAGDHHRDRSDRQPGDRHRRQTAGRQTPQHRRPAGVDRRRPGGPRPARHRTIRGDDRAHRRRSAARISGAGVRVEQAGSERNRQALCANGFAGPAVAVCRWAGAGAEPAGRQRLDQHQDQGPQSGQGDRRRAGVAVRQAAGLRGTRVRSGHPVAGRNGGRVRLHRNRGPAHRDHRGQGGYGEAGADGPGDLR